MIATDDMRAAVSRLEEGFGQESDYLAAFQSMSRLADVIDYAAGFIEPSGRWYTIHPQNLLRIAAGDPT